jgi:two-component system CitB family sensor kinase
VSLLRRCRGSSVARQILVLQALTLAVLVVGALVLSYVEARRTQVEGARDRSVAVAQAVADSPDVVEALAGEDPSALIQPYAEQVRRDTGTDFVVVMELDRTRFSHPDPDRIGERFIGDLGGAPKGEVFTQEYTGTLGPSMRAVVPVYDAGEVVALVSVGITVERIDEALRSRLLPIVGAGVLMLGVGLAGAWLISRRLRRQTHGLGEQEMARMYEYYEAVLHAVREGLVLLDDAGRVQLLNDEATRLLDLPEEVLGWSVLDLDIPRPLAVSVREGRVQPDEIHLVGDRVLVVNQAEARWDGRVVGSVLTLRDHTELQAVSGELDTVRGMAEALRSQNHEAANRLHTVVSLIEIGRADEALEFATAELRSAQVLTDQVVGAVEDPVVAALLLGKSAQAAERGIELRIDPATRVADPFVEARDMVTLMGNLLDNAFDAVAEAPVKRVQTCLSVNGSGLRLEVADTGSGLPAGMAERVFERGWSTKRGDVELGRGLGLALVGQVVRKYGGTVEAGAGNLGGAAFRVRIDRPGGAA